MQLQKVPKSFSVSKGSRWYQWVISINSFALKIHSNWASLFANEDIAKESKFSLFLIGLGLTAAEWEFPSTYIGSNAAQARMSDLMN